MGLFFAREGARMLEGRKKSGGARVRIFGADEPAAQDGEA